ncbi:MAG TPA: SPASM domain-containing protein [Pirellulales bacterium]|nr:SPASM domain-containing protein [Pirellulales bacterium]
MQDSYTIYLAVPGKQYCWGTVTGVVNSTAKHTALPFTGGFGFSGVEDFNMLWTDAHNMYEQGEITHFAMLHGDITPDPTQKWLDILMDEMHSHSAAMVSTVSPIKDKRGLTSSGIADLDDPWRPWRRFTVREIHSWLPPTFNNVLAGYPDRPLLHNTGLWVADLRRPVFHRANDRGEMDLYFQFPTRSVRDPATGKWMHQRESEDWLFSRELWTRNVRSTYITSKVRVSHSGSAIWGTHSPWGELMDGDDDTADKWRPEQDAKPLRTLQMIEFELGSACNLGHMHPECPNLHPERYGNLDVSRELDDDTIISAAVDAYENLGFTGLVGWIYYNEPLLEADRMFHLMREIKWRAPRARFILWTNGMMIPDDCERYRDFSQIVVSEYNSASRRGFDRLISHGIDAKLLPNAKMDDRLVNIEPTAPGNTEPCLRPFVELIIDNHGNSHLCCYDWQGKGTFGNIFDTPFAEIAATWRNQLPHIVGPQMDESAPGVCRACGHRRNKYQQHDDAVITRARRFREGLCK